MSQILASDPSNGLDPTRIERHLPELLQQYVPDPTPLAALPPGRHVAETAVPSGS